MSKTFRPWDGHMAHFVRDTVRDGLDLSEILDCYEEERGYPRTAEKVRRLDAANRDGTLTASFFIRPRPKTVIGGHTYARCAAFESSARPATSRGSNRARSTSDCRGDGRWHLHLPDGPLENLLRSGAPIRGN